MKKVISAMLLVASVSIFAQSPGGPAEAVPRTALVVPQMERPALKLLDFGLPEPANQKSTIVTASNGRVSFMPNPSRTVAAAAILLDLPQGPAGGLAQIFSKTPMRLATMQKLRVAWDMQILEDRPNAYTSGLALGDPAGAHAVAIQYGPTGPVHHQISVGTESHTDNVDHGLKNLHYDLTVSLTDAETGAAKLDLCVFEADGKFDAAPEKYLSEGKLVSVLSGPGKLPAGQDFQLYFYVDISDAKGDKWGQERGIIRVANVYCSQAQ